MYEVDTLLSNLQDKQAWEQTRLIAYLLAQTNSKKKLKLTDILSFDWDKEKTSTGNTSISNEDIDRLKQKAKLIQKQNGFSS